MIHSFLCYWCGWLVTGGFINSCFNGSAPLLIIAITNHGLVFSDFWYSLKVQFRTFTCQRLLPWYTGRDYPNHRTLDTVTMVTIHLKHCVRDPLVWKPVSHRADVPVIGQCQLPDGFSGVMIFFLQQYRRFNPNELKTQNVLHLNGCFVAIYVKKSSQNPMINVLRISCNYQKTCYLWDSMKGHEHFVLAGRLHRFHKNLFSFTVSFVKLCSSAAAVHLADCYWSRCLNGVSSNWQGKYVVVQLQDTPF